jgi:hypothetical protein
MFDTNSADLDWLAFQYVSDELSSEEAARFEERLADDQAAREAVAGAMLLVQAVAAGATLVSPAATHRSWLQPAAWAGIGAAACLALVFVLRSPPRDEVQPVAVQPPPVSELSSAELALVWAQSNALAEAMMADVLADDDTSLATESRDADRDFVVPAWMLEALSGSQEAGPAVKQSQES